MAWRENANITKLRVAELTMGDGVALSGLSTGAVNISKTIASQAASAVIERRNVTATITGGNYLMGSYQTYESGATFGATGFMIGQYTRLEVAHVIQDTYAIWGKCNISGAQPGDTSNQHVGVFGSMSIEGVACALADTGGCYAVLGVASIASGGTLDQPLYAGYFDAGAVDNIAGNVACVRAKMQKYCDYGIDVHCYTNNNEAAIRLMPTDAAKLSSGIKFYASAVGGQSYIHSAFEFVSADKSDGAYVTTTTITNPETAEAIIKIDCAGTNFYIPAYNAASIDTEWADQ